MTAPPMDVLRAARDWAVEHGHESPDDRLVELVYAAGRRDAAAAVRALPADHLFEMRMDVAERCARVAEGTDR